MEKILHSEIKSDRGLVRRLKPVLERNRGKFVYKRHASEDELTEYLSEPAQINDYELGIIAQEGDLILEELGGLRINVNKLHAFKDRRRDPNKSGCSRYNISIVLAGVDYYIGAARQLAKLDFFPELKSALEKELAKQE